MSKIANRTLLIPEKVTVSQNLDNFTVNGPNGILVQKIPFPVELTIINQSLSTRFIQGVEIKNEALLGTMNSLVSNMLRGVTDGYQKVLEIRGVGYKVSLENETLNFSLGYSHNILLKVPPTLKIDCINNTRLVIKGADKQEVGWFASKIRAFRKPNVFVKTYKGIFYQGEKIKIKSGKKEGKK